MVVNDIRIPQKMKQKCDSRTAKVPVSSYKSRLECSDSILP